MARSTFMSSLSIEEREEVNSRLRESFYGDQDGLLEWLNEQGVETSKSAVNRYAVALREADGFENDNSYKIAAKGVIIGGKSRKEDILIELGLLKVKEMELWDEYRSISG